MLKFRISHILMLLAIFAVAFAWYVDHNQMRAAQHRITYGEKQYLWSPSAYLDRDTQFLESQLADRIQNFAGELSQSSQGMGSEQGRHPTIETLDAVVALLDDTDEATRLAATQLIALYLENVSGSTNFDKEKNLTTRVHFQIFGMPKARRMLAEANPDIRGAAALVLGNTFYDQRTAQAMMQTFDNDHHEGVRVRLAWAYWKLTNLPR